MRKSMLLCPVLNIYRTTLLGRQIKLVYDAVNVNFDYAERYAGHKNYQFQGLNTELLKWSIILATLKIDCMS